MQGAFLSAKLLAVFARIAVSCPEEARFEGFSQFSQRFLHTPRNFHHFVATLSNGQINNSV